MLTRTRCEDALRRGAGARELRSPIMLPKSLATAESIDLFTPPKLLKPLTAEVLTYC
jgi:hypothetical protein